MPLSGAKIKEMLHSCNNEDDFAEKLARAINQNLTVVIPAGAVLIGATGGVPNPSPITCQVIPG